jgi:microcystin-dependent protein
MALSFTGQILDDVLLSRVDGPVGTYRHSDLTLAQFLTQTPGVWVLADGQACTGSLYSQITGKANVPDMRGTVPRMKDNGRGLNPDGDLALGSYQADMFQDHSHSIYANTSNENGSTNPFSSGATGEGSGSHAWVTYNMGGAASGNMGPETRAKSTTVNIFFKIGY